MRRISEDEGASAWNRWLAATAASQVPSQADMAMAVRYSLQEITDRAPGRSVELRVIPFGATQIIAGGAHRRGTPPAVIEMEAQTWLDLAAGRRSWADALDAGAVNASGERADLGALLPLFA